MKNQRQVTKALLGEWIRRTREIQKVVNDQEHELLLLYAYYDPEVSALDKFKVINPIMKYFATKEIG